VIQNRTLAATLVVAGLLLAPVAPLGAEEARAPLILTIIGAPVEKLEAALRESLRAAPAPRPWAQWQMLPDGSARFGNAAFGVVVKNPCPGHVPVALPDLNSH